MSIVPKNVYFDVIAEYTHNDYMYLYHDEHDTTDTQAIDRCRAWGGNLASITSREESLFVSSQRLTHTGRFNRGNKYYCLIGLFSNYTSNNCPVCADSTFLCNVDTTHTSFFCQLDSIIS